MITEDYVSFETAKLLKEKGFRENCIATYNLVTKNFEIEEACQDWTTRWKAYVSAPTLQMAMKWLRREHGLHCSVDYDYILGWYCQITNLKGTVEYDYEEMKHYHPEKDNGFSSSEEACEAAIKYCLENLI